MNSGSGNWVWGVGCGVEGYRGALYQGGLLFDRVHVCSSLQTGGDLMQTQHLVAVQRL
jgi:hypothetical protein